MATTTTVAVVATGLVLIYIGYRLYRLGRVGHLDVLSEAEVLEIRKRGAEEIVRAIGGEPTGLWRIPLFLYRVFPLEWYLRLEKRGALRAHTGEIERAIDPLIGEIKNPHCLNALIALKGFLQESRRGSVADEDYARLTEKIIDIEDNLEVNLDFLRKIDTVYCQLEEAASRIAQESEDEADGIIEFFNGRLEDAVAYQSFLGTTAFYQILRELEIYLEACRLSGASAGRGTDSSTSHNDHYEILGVELGATKEEIKEAYLRKVNEYHTDKIEVELNRIEDSAVRERMRRLFHEKMILINEAYKALSKA